MKKFVMTHDEVEALWSNARYFAGYFMRVKPIGEGKFFVQTNYPWVQA